MDTDANVVPTSVDSSTDRKRIHVSLEPLPEPRINKYLEGGRELLDEYVRCIQ